MRIFVAMTITMMFLALLNCGVLVLSGNIECNSVWDFVKTWLFASVIYTLAISLTWVLLDKLWDKVL